jgi:hypothetical protein
MKEKYNFAYKSQKASIRAFLVTELIGLLFLSIARLLGYVLKSQNLKLTLYIYSYSGIRTVI